MDFICSFLYNSCKTYGCYMNSCYYSFCTGAELFDQRHWLLRQAFEDKETGVRYDLLLGTNQKVIHQKDGFIDFINRYIQVAKHVNLVFGKQLIWSGPTCISLEEKVGKGKALIWRILDSREVLTIIRSGIEMLLPEKSEVVSIEARISPNRFFYPIELPSEQLSKIKITQLVMPSIIVNPATGDIYDLCIETTDLDYFDSPTVSQKTDFLRLYREGVTQAGINYANNRILSGEITLVANQLTNEVRSILTPKLHEIFRRALDFIAPKIQQRGGRFLMTAQKAKTVTLQFV